MFESLGHDCEVGLLQRRFGAELLGLFRWGGTHIVRLIEALDNNFSGLGDEQYNSIVPISELYYLEERRYGLSRHAHVRVDSGANVEELLKRQLEQTTLYLRFFRETLEDGLKVFAYKDLDNADPVVIVDLGRVLRRHGPADLVVVHQHLRQGDAAEVDRLNEHTWLARPDHFGGRPDRWDIAFDQWLFIMRAVLSQRLKPSIL